MNLLMRLLEILIQFTIILMFSYSILTYWGFETKHFIMIAEGKVPKRVQVYNPSKSNLSKEKSNPSNVEDLKNNTDVDTTILSPKSPKRNSPSTSLTTLDS